MVFTLNWQAVKKEGLLLKKGSSKCQDMEIKQFGAV